MAKDESGTSKETVGPPPARTSRPTGSARPPHSSFIIHHSSFPDVGYRLAARTAVVAGVFSAMVAAMLLTDYSRRRAEDPLEVEQFHALKAALVEQPGDERLKEEIRTLDLGLREEYFRARRFAERGTWLLFGGIVVLLVSAKATSTLRRKLPMPEAQAAPEDTETPTMRLARWSVGVLLVLLLGSVAALNLTFRTELASLPKPEEPKPGPAPTVDSSFPTDEEIHKNWHRFRGPGGLGISAYDNVPTGWDAASGEGILWKTPVPLEGLNSPVVWEDRVFLSGGAEERLEVYCFDAGDGKLLWQQEVKNTASETIDPEFTGFAAPSTTTDGRRVFAMFATGDVAAFDFSGKPLWTRSFGVPDNGYGHGSSPILFQNRLMIQFDQGGTAKEGKSKLLALDALTGKTVYEVPRPVPNSWTTPCLMPGDGGVQLITVADPWVIAYNPSDGSEIWRANCMSGECGPSPVFVDGVVHVGNEYCVWSAIRADGKGDVTETHVLWTAEDGLPDMCSPLVTSEYLFVLATWGALTCYDSKTGELLWEKDFDASFTSSPGWAAGRVYLVGDEGKGWILEPGREEENVKQIAETNLGEECVTSPAFQDGRLYLRGKEHLFCIGMRNEE
ncbi:MAG: PQQ-binding-like beta-propeller repeat protein [Planctomycetota bacterium]